MEGKNQIVEMDKKFKYQEPIKADKELTESFWKTLRHFYRTGEKPEQKSSENHKSIFTELFDKEDSKYPYTYDEIEEKSFDLDNDVVFQILNQQLKEHLSRRREDFRENLFQLLSGLEKILKVDPEFKVEDMEKTYEFANTLMAFDKMAKIVSRKSAKGADINEVRTKRLKSTLKTLQEGIKNFQGILGTILISNSIWKQYDFNKIFNKSNVQKIYSEEIFEEAVSRFNEEIENYVELVQAYRIASLEADGKYQNEIHDEYFSHFTRHRFTDEEAELIQPLIVIINSEDLLKNTSSLLNIMAAGFPIKVLILKEDLVSRPVAEKSWEDAAHQFRQEIAALAISQRNVFAFQSALSDPDIIQKGFDALLKSQSPAIAQILLDSSEKNRINTEFLLRSASRSRYFPNLIFDPSNTSASQKMDLSLNDQVENIWPIYGIELINEKEQTSNKELAFTYADYKALYPEKLDELLIVPAEYYSENLFPLDKYLELDEKSLYGKIPFIYLIDKNNSLQKAAVPNLWVVSCQEREDYWNFLKQFSDRSNSSRGEVIDAPPDKNNENIVLSKTEYEEKLMAIQENAIQIAAERMIKGLLGDDDILNEFMNADVKTVEKPNLIKKEEAASEEKTEVQPEEPANIEASLDTEDCTSCNECVDQFPHLFQYNEDKLAELKDPRKGTFEELVKAAEKCPAECIHPGLPLNPDEPNIEKLKKRAEKFN